MFTNREMLLHQVGDHGLERAGSVADAHVLRRKGHLKEQDDFIDFIISLHTTHTPEEAMAKLERWVEEHRLKPERSTLKGLVHSVGQFFTHLPLVHSLREYDALTHLTSRRFVMPNFAEIRHILNIAQVHASAPQLRLLTFDADGTLYEDGAHLEEDDTMISRIITLMRLGVVVVIVTAAGYPGRPERFEQRVTGLMAALHKLNLSELQDKFLVMGGECNYLLRPDENWRLQLIDPTLWQSPEMLSYKQADVEAVLDQAQSLLLESAERLGMKVELVRKERAVGIVPQKVTMFEALEDIALTVQAELADSSIPFCCFNGGNDVFVDIGNKNLGISALMSYMAATPAETLFVGDRFTVTGNDSNVKGCCPILWVANPEETGFFLNICLDRRGAKASV